MAVNDIEDLRRMMRIASDRTAAQCSFRSYGYNSFAWSIGFAISHLDICNQLLSNLIWCN